MSSARDGDAHMISLFGELDLATADGVRTELDRVEATDAQAIVLDLGGLTSIDSAGVRLLLSAGARERAGSNRLTLRRGSPERAAGARAVRRAERAAVRRLSGPPAGRATIHHACTCAAPAVTAHDSSPRPFPEERPWHSKSDSA